MDKCFDDIQNVKKLKFRWDWTELRPKLLLWVNPGQNIWNEIQKSSKTEKVKTFWYTLIYCCVVVGLVLPTFNFWKGDWALGYVSTQLWDFTDISLFPKILTLKSFGNSWGNSYTKFAILANMFPFTCGQLDPY